MRIGLALPHYDYSVPGESPLRFETIVTWACRAEELGFDSLWISDHLSLDLAKYGGPAMPYGAFEPLSTIAALARVVPRVRFGTLVLCEALRPAAVLAKTLATLDRLAGGRLDVGMGAGWHEPDYEAIGIAMPSAGERIARLREALTILTELLAGGPCTFEGRWHAARGAVVDPPPLQQPRPPVFVGGKGDRVIQTAVELSDGWNTCWVWTPDGYRDRLRALERACEASARDPATVWRSLGLYALCGENEADLRRRFDRLRAAAPPGTLAVDLDEWRVGRLVGTVEQVREQAVVWSDLGVETLIVSLGAVPFQVSALDDLEPVIAALRTP
ncbi:MAG: LLM class flavin-dependent oxidoreductase [Actinobacteria bacterium]|nr:MAG: LLM class flavin-dependent oxidoreductase [Actinomycetota bacterium]